MVLIQIISYGKTGHIQIKHAIKNFEHSIAFPIYAQYRCKTLDRILAFRY